MSVLFEVIYVWSNVCVPTRTHVWGIHVSVYVSWRPGIDFEKSSSTILYFIKQLSILSVEAKPLILIHNLLIWLVSLAILLWWPLVSILPLTKLQMGSYAHLAFKWVLRMWMNSHAHSCVVYNLSTESSLQAL